MPPHPTFFVTRNVYVKHGTFNTALHNAADYEIMLRFLYKTGIKVAYIPQVLVKMRQGGLSNSSWKSRIKANREDRLAWKINQLEPTPFTLWLKPVRKIPQFIARFFNLG
jgi:glycosyltransferase